MFFNRWAHEWRKVIYLVYRSESLYFTENLCKEKTLIQLSLGGENWISRGCIRDVYWMGVHGWQKFKWSGLCSSENGKPTKSAQQGRLSSSARNWVNQTAIRWKQWSIQSAPDTQYLNSILLRNLFYYIRTGEVKYLCFFPMRFLV